ncbi:transcription/translation regulatory transformer protein RfaH [Vibrio hippocampi]|uniref:Transcription antitermination protein RfaH n=1 Tax=Vibrio hippocampi TaxID=654686 RepID=A0ABN8DKW4_9VIBR|nr:transcription/translation regulatory transformer protein RfaH [Vibrio hippocampi]CAH0526748.1 Transcription antitermination protein RfaH [Vibrio hippocampi]
MKSWYLLYCKRGEQERAKSHLANQGLECYYPEVMVEKVRRGKIQSIKEPLFPNYVFVKFDYQTGPSFTSVRSTRGVVDFVRTGAMPTEVNPDLVYDLQQLDSEFELQKQVDLPETGDVVRIKAGQFAGVEAIFQQADGEMRSIMLVQLINQSTPVSIDNRDLEL